jgi:branched-chain amino acid aminotransferase
MSERLVYMNGEFVPESQSKLSIYDSALMFGDMVFEMTRSFNKKQFLLRKHLERLYAGLKILRIPVQMTIEEMEKACHETVKINDSLFASDDEHRLMINVTRGTLGIYQDVVGIHKGPNVIIADFPLRWTVRGMSRLFKNGINLVTPSQRQIPANLLDPKLKNRSRIHYLMANIQVSDYQGENNWALLLDQEGFIAEGTGSNFFLVKNGKIYTPKPIHILRGVSRDYVINTLAKQLGIEVIETDLETYDLITADEAFMTATPFCILPVVSFGGTKLNNEGSIPGKITNALLTQWSENIGIDIVNQIKVWDEGYTENLSAPTPYKFKSSK